MWVVGDTVLESGSSLWKYSFRGNQSSGMGCKTGTCTAGGVSLGCVGGSTDIATGGVGSVGGVGVMAMGGGTTGTGICLAKRYKSVQHDSNSSYKLPVRFDAKYPTVSFGICTKYKSLKLLLSGVPTLVGCTLLAET
jgi:hypothetical protein